MSILGHAVHHAKGTLGKRSARTAPLRFVTFLAPRLFSFYEFIARHVGQRLEWPTEIRVGSSYDELTTDADVAFVCGLPYVEAVRARTPEVEPIAAPVPQGERYRNQPIYFSDVIVRRDSPFWSF